MCDNSFYFKLLLIPLIQLILGGFLYLVAPFGAGDGHADVLYFVTGFPGILLQFKTDFFHNLIGLPSNFSDFSTVVFEPCIINFILIVFIIMILFIYKRIKVT